MDAQRNETTKKLPNCYNFSIENESTILNCSYIVEEYEDCEEFYFYLEVIQTYFIPVIIVFGLIGNLLSAIIFLTTNLRKRSSSMYLGALSITDFGFLFVLSIVDLSYANILDIYNIEFFCQVFVFISTVCSNVSVWLIVAFTAERFIAVQYPLQRPHVCTVSRAKLIIYCIFIVNSISQLYIFWASGVIIREEDKAECEMLEHFTDYMKIINFLDTIFSLIVPLILIVFLNTMIARALYRFKKKMFKVRTQQYYHDDEDSSRCTKSSEKRRSIEVTRSSQNSRQGKSNENSNSCNDVERNFLMIKSQRNITKMLLVISTVFIILNVPSYALRLYIFSMKIMHKEVASVWCIQQLAMSLFYTNYSINFLLYSMCGATFRHALFIFIKHNIVKVKNCCCSRT